jgi:predicted nucleic acid-binding protein
MNAIDTNVFVYLIDHTEPDKQQRAAELIQQARQDRGSTLLPWQVAGEYLNCLRRWEREGRLPTNDVEPYLSRVTRLFPLAFPTSQVLTISLDLTSRYSLSHWDSMLLAACVDAGVDTLYSEDLDNGMTYDSVTVVNPFA